MMTDDTRTPEQEIEYLRDELRGANKRANDNYDAGHRWKKEADALKQENASLRNDLHEMTVEKARLEGYIDRTREFDPPEEPVPMVPPRVRYGRAGRQDICDSMYPRERREPWYRRA